MTIKDVVLATGSALFSPLIVMALQAFINRMTKGSPQLLTMISMILGYPFFFIAIFQMPFSIDPDFTFLIYLFLIYSFSAYTYFHIFNMSETSRRVRMIQSIANNSRLINIDELYDDSAMVEIRLERLLALGQIKKENDLFFSRGNLFYFTAVIFYTISRFFNIPWPAVQRFYTYKKERGLI